MKKYQGIITLTLTALICSILLYIVVSVVNG